MRIRAADIGEVGHEDVDTRQRRRHGATHVNVVVFQDAIELHELLFGDELGRSKAAV